MQQLCPGKPYSAIEDKHKLNYFYNIFIAISIMAIHVGDINAQSLKNHVINHNMSFSFANLCIKGTIYQEKNRFFNIWPSNT